MNEKDRDAGMRRRGDAGQQKESDEEKTALLSPRRPVPASPPHLSSSPRLLRVFCAVELPADVRAQAARYIAELRETAPEARASWEREEKMHLTLKFLGEMEEDRVSALIEATESAASEVRPFELRLRGTGAFPPRGLPRVLWLGVEDHSGGLARLHEKLESECARASFKREAKRFHPHLTIARLRSHEGAHRLASLHLNRDFETEAFHTSEIVIIKSDLGPHGSSYTPIAGCGLRNAD